MEMLIFWLPCAFPVIGVVLLCVAMLATQVWRDRKRRKHRKSGG